jgi:hypothetical protein
VRLTFAVSAQPSRRVSERVFVTLATLSASTAATARPASR